jgi:isoaspartyl peptidase/L-asparaginase-like protein (Ntn-hydrolase superfamily)
MLTCLLAFCASYSMSFVALYQRASGTKANDITFNSSGRGGAVTCKAACMYSRQLHCAVSNCSVGEMIMHATAESLIASDWQLNMEVSDMVSTRYSKLIS